MSRTIGLERLYPLGKFSNIRVEDSITVPEEVQSKEKYIKNAYVMLMINVELTYLKYVKMSAKLASLSLEEQIQLLEEAKVATMDELKKLDSEDNDNDEEEV